MANERLSTTITDQCDLKGVHSSGSNTRLPNELLSLILHHLHQQRPTLSREIDEQQATLFTCTLVSRQLYSLANPLLWEAPILKTHHISKRFQDCVLHTSSRNLASVGQHIRQLHLTYQLWSDEQLVQLVPHLPHVIHLVLHSKSITDRTFRSLPRHCPQLESLDLHCALTKTSFDAIGKHCQRLVDLTVQQMQSPDDLKMLTRLERLQLGLDWHHFDNVLSDLATLDRLTTLKIYQYPPQPIGSPRTIPPHLCPKLKHFSLDHCYHLDDATLTAFVSSHPDLQQLCLRDAHLLTDATLDAIAIWLPRITHVTLTYNRHITLARVHQLIRQCPQLDYVDVHGCDCVMANDWDGVTFGQLQVDKIRQMTLV